MVPTNKVIPFRAEAHRLNFLVTRSFDRDAKRVFTQEELDGFLNFVSANPDCGKKIKGGEGLRKIRWKAGGQGKRGGARVIYYFRDLNMPLLLLSVYTKKEKEDLNAGEIKAIKERMNEIVAGLSTTYVAQASGESA